MSEFEEVRLAALGPMRSLVRLAAFFLLLAGAQASEPAAAQRSSIRAMQASVAAQRATVARMRALSAPRLQSWSGSSTALALVSPQPAPRPDLGCVPLPADEVEQLAAEAAAREGLAAGLLRAVIDTESAALPCAVSSKGAMGLMQLMPATALDLAVENPLDPKENVNAGARFLKQLLARYSGDLALALGAYNAGPSRVDAAGGIPDIPETVDYVSRILSRLGITAGAF